MKILITGALGQLGSELAPALRSAYGETAVVLSDIRSDVNRALVESGPFFAIDCRDAAALAAVVSRERITRIYHLAALLSATGEARPQEAWDININGLTSVLEVAREYSCSVFTPSSIAAFGPTAPKDHTPQDTIQRPTSIYGITKVAGELLCDYYYKRYNVDTRGVRYPGIISSVTAPGGGTTDYAVHIYYAAVRDHRYECFLKGDSCMDMIYMPDAIQAAIDLMEADPSQLRHRNAFNITSMSFTPEDQAAYIRKYIPDFEISYNIDPVRQALANSWPNVLEDYAARVEWGWTPRYDLDATTADMLSRIAAREPTTVAPADC
ncbi:MAG: NAD-dependent epimerase/dehydratase family protein [Spirochaetaceae bacterium]|nr:MAG: NAD-dependent epimerase/dehydratase family protein [Spirochaetaceae bacterium]